MEEGKVLVEVRDLLVEIRDLLVPVAAVNREAYEQWLVAEERRKQVRDALSSDKRRAAWALADGTRTQRQIAQESGLDEGNASRFFKRLRELHSLTDAANPTRAIEV